MQIVGRIETIDEARFGFKGGTLRGEEGTGSAHWGLTRLIADRLVSGHTVMMIGF